MAVNRLLPDKKVSHIRNSVKATVDAYDGTVSLYARDETDPVLQAWMKAFRERSSQRARSAPSWREHLRYPEDLFEVQRMLLAKYHVDDPVTFFSTSDFWDVPLDPNPTASSYQPPYYIVAKDLAKNDNSSSFQLTTAMNRFRRDFLAAYISPAPTRDLRQDHRADHPRSGQRPQARVQRHLHRHPRCPRTSVSSAATTRTASAGATC